MNHIEKVLVANRGEIATRIIRAVHELGLTAVGIYSEEDMNAVHRRKADEAYLVGKGASPTGVYLDIEAIIEIAKENDVDAIHPGYGFLSENRDFARRCEEEDIIFIGPELKHLEMFGDKISGIETAVEAGLDVVPGSDGAVESVQEVFDFAEEYDYPVMLKAVSGGGGKGMRIVYKEDEVEEAFNRAQSEAETSFGDGAIYLEKYIENPKHIEVQIIGDTHGNGVHLYERDCSIQRRHQKVVEVAPAFNLDEKLRKEITDASLQLLNHVDYVNAGTIEFLVSGNNFYFIEVNPRIQVEHTITEMVTDIDIVKTQILVADGESLFGEVINMPQQEDITTNGYAIQSRITTEDPVNDFAPDSGKITDYEVAGGPGIRVDAGDAYTGAEIQPFYDSLLLKLCTHADTVEEVIHRTDRALEETKIVGLKTNISFLRNIVNHPTFIKGESDTTFIAEHKEIFDVKPQLDDGSRIAEYFGEVTVNGFPGIQQNGKPDFPERQIPEVPEEPTHKGRSYKHILDEEGPEAVIEAVLKEENTLLTDTTLRDAHQSMLTTRMRTKDMRDIAPYMNQTMQDHFSLEMWGGATFDVAYNFLKESPWERLTELRELIPDIPFQMLLRASNAVGYNNYPDNIVTRFIHESADKGIDVFRIFDSQNWIETMKLPIEEALKTGKLVEGAICYTGDFLNPERSDTYTLQYYVDLAKELEDLGVHLISIKDMSGILKPEAAYQLVKALKEESNLPIHLHMHDTSGNAITTLSRAIDAGVDIVDTANSSVSGQNSQPDSNALYYARQGKERTIELDVDAGDKMAEYWKTTRKYYQPFESDLVNPWTEVYKFEMPGGQYSNIQAQARSVGLGDRFDDVLDMYQRVNALLGDVIKVTPSSKVVGDLSLFMVTNDLDEQSVIEEGPNLDFPDSVVSFFRGEIGQPPNGFNKELQKVVVKGQDVITDRPGNHIPDYDFTQAYEALEEYMPNEDIDETKLLSYAMYPKVYEDFLVYYERFGKIDVIDTPDFFYGLELGETTTVELDKGKILTVKYKAIGPVQEDGKRTLYYDLNGAPFEVDIVDTNVEASGAVKKKADKTNEKHIGAQMPGSVVSIDCAVGDEIQANDVIIVTEAMKMESAIHAPIGGVVKDIYVNEKDQVEGGDLLIEFE